MVKKAYGFTIVELLIVIVVIAILATISVAAYNGIQQRSNNTTIINAASQTLKAVQMYIAQEGRYPATNVYICVTTESGCIQLNGTDPSATNTSFDTNMAAIGNLPRSVSNSGTRGNGILYHHIPDRQFNGQPRPAILYYFLKGRVDCGLPGVMSGWGSVDQPATPSTTGRSAYDSTYDKTVCWVSIPN
jgi:prepilin-type N-terminal cleavage/methylation domain-containing protein